MENRLKLGDWVKADVIGLGFYEVVSIDDYHINLKCLRIFDGKNPDYRNHVTNCHHGIDKVTGERIKKGDKVFFANKFYEVAEIIEQFGGKMIGIYDEKPSKHIDYLNPNSIDIVKFKKIKFSKAQQKVIDFLVKYPTAYIIKSSFYNHNDLVVPKEVSEYPIQFTRPTFEFLERNLIIKLLEGKKYVLADTFEAIA
ncbi:hypothetical protein BWK60_07750 [Flavobacterium covae]|uniref:hypothetical protein n=1 Tax=Flavobacterium covae TaxID=2906076 RepID=UPI000B4CEE1E|nr:hypothetical protein [Flavobacterium covae]OWP86666.1 hypothetical protein BWK60_07750 [Flavobacterium covae]